MNLLNSKIKDTWYLNIKWLLCYFYLLWENSYNDTFMYMYLNAYVLLSICFLHKATIYFRILKAKKRINIDLPVINWK